MTLIASYLKSCSELCRFCSHDGFIDTDSLRFSIVMEVGNEIIVEIEFDEVLLAGCGSPAGRVPCHGQMHLFTDRYGHVIRAEVL
jgi:hypothetical protein